MMRIRPIPTSITLLMLAIVLVAPVVTEWFTSHAQTPPKSYCSASICADASAIQSSRLSESPEAVVHYFTMNDGSTGGVYVGSHPRRPRPEMPKTSQTIDGVACDRYELPGDSGNRQISLFCDWRRKPDDAPNAIHAWAVAKAPEASEAMALVRSLRRCDAAECP